MARDYKHFITLRSVAQLASALVWGTRGRGFKPHRSDLIESINMLFPKQPNNPKENPPSPSYGVERRKHKRLKKHFILSYFDVTNPEHKFELKQLKNISQGGICFVTTIMFPPGTILGIELKTPYLADVTYLEGVVLESHEKIKGMIYEIRLEFKVISPQAEFVLSKLIEFFAHTES